MPLHIMAAERLLATVQGTRVRVRFVPARCAGKRCRPPRGNGRDELLADRALYAVYARSGMGDPRAPTGRPPVSIAIRHMPLCGLAGGEMVGKVGADGN